MNSSPEVIEEPDHNKSKDLQLGVNLVNYQLINAHDD